MDSSASRTGSPEVPRERHESLPDESPQGNRLQLELLRLEVKVKNAPEGERAFLIHQTIDALPDEDVEELDREMQKGEQADVPPAFKRAVEREALLQGIVARRAAMRSELGPAPEPAPVYVPSAIRPEIGPRKSPWSVDWKNVAVIGGTVAVGALLLRWLLGRAEKAKKRAEKTFSFMKWMVGIGIVTTGIWLGFKGWEKYREIMQALKDAEKWKDLAARGTGKAKEVAQQKLRVAQNKLSDLKNSLSEEQKETLREEGVNVSAAGLMLLHQEQASAVGIRSDSHAEVGAFRGILHLPGVREIPVGTLLAIASQQQANGLAESLGLRSEPDKKAIFFLARVCQDRLPIIERIAAQGHPPLDARTMSVDQVLRETSHVPQFFAKIGTALSGKSLRDLDIGQVSRVVGESLAQHPLRLLESGRGLQADLEKMGIGKDQREKFALFCLSARDVNIRNIHLFDAENRSFAPEERQLFVRALQGMHRRLQASAGYLALYTHKAIKPGENTYQSILEKYLNEHAKVNDVLQLYSYLHLAEGADGAATAPTTLRDSNVEGAFLLQMKVLQMIAATDPDYGMAFKGFLGAEVAKAVAGTPTTIELPPQVIDILKKFGKMFLWEGVPVLSKGFWRRYTAFTNLASGAADVPEPILRWGGIAAIPGWLSARYGSIFMTYRTIHLAKTAKEMEGLSATLRNAFDHPRLLWRIARSAPLGIGRAFYYGSARKLIGGVQELMRQRIGAVPTYRQIEAYVTAHSLVNGQTVDLQQLRQARAIMHEQGWTAKIRTLLGPHVENQMKILTQLEQVPAGAAALRALPAHVSVEIIDHIVRLDDAGRAKFVASLAVDAQEAATILRSCQGLSIDDAASFLLHARKQNAAEVGQLLTKAGYDPATIAETMKNVTAKTTAPAAARDAFQMTGKSGALRVAGKWALRGVGVAAVALEAKDVYDSGKRIVQLKEARGQLEKELTSLLLPNLFRRETNGWKFTHVATGVEIDATPLFRANDDVVALAYRNMLISGGSLLATTAAIAAGGIAGAFILGLAVPAVIMAKWAKDTEEAKKIRNFIMDCPQELLVMLPVENAFGMSLPQATQFVSENIPWSLARGLPPESKTVLAKEKMANAMLLRRITALSPFHLGLRSDRGGNGLTGVFGPLPFSLYRDDPSELWKLRHPEKHGAELESIVDRAASRALRLYLAQGYLRLHDRLRQDEQDRSILALQANLRKEDEDLLLTPEQLRMIERRLLPNDQKYALQEQLDLVGTQPFSGGKTITECMREGLRFMPSSRQVRDAVSLRDIVQRAHDRGEAGDAIIVEQFNYLSDALDADAPPTSVVELR